MTFDAVSDIFGFFRAWIADPLRVAAPVPSGKALANAITAEISAATGPIIELGPGTGAFTRALISRGVRQEDLTLIEYGSEFAVKLQHRFPDAKVLWMDAARLRSVELFTGTPAGATISGLPLLSMPPRKVMAILDGAFGKMRPNGAFYQFTYAPYCPVPRPLLDRLGLKATRISRAFANLPPAAVYKIRRRPRRAATVHRHGSIAVGSLASVQQESTS
ncbi:Phospholipid N-methyltransferase [Mesorhizobium plurifarium]|uniref:Phospholipid N-methyltransferase n=1 Tax=Mesorhizobium plurifarium TaxID=69974 RepID=A0A090G6X6_MESPL|nr:Phospholipid N-methyltransferase [Mesorhizobium plurifarium]